jgi:DNA sulfur modification protein DndE
MISFNRIRISEKATHRLIQLKGRTGLTPNILARLAICYSLNDPSIPDPEFYDEKGMEMNRFTLTGEWDTFFIALIKERCIHDNLDPETELLPQLRAHLNRGVFGIFPLIKGLGDLQSLIKHQGAGIKSDMRSEGRSHGN